MTTLIGRVYKIVCDVTDFGECYVGSTFDSLINRFCGHKDNYTKWKNEGSGYTSSYELFEKYGFDSCEIVLIKEYEVLDRRHLEVYESLWIHKLKSINKIDPVGGMLKKYRETQWFKENKEEMKLYGKEYYEKNKENRKLYGKEYYEKNKEEIKLYKKEYCEKNKEELKLKWKKYRENNKEEINRKEKEYRNNNKEEINRKKREKIKCQVCLYEVSRSDLSQHYKTQKHVKNLLHYASIVIHILTLLRSKEKTTLHSAQ